MGPTGIQRLLKKLSEGASLLQSGQVYNYALAILLYTALISLQLRETGSIEMLFILPLLILLFNNPSQRTA